MNRTVNLLPAGLTGALLSLTTLLSTVAAQTSGSGHTSLASLDNVMLNALAAQGIPGATVAASRGGRLVFNKAYGVRDLSTGQPMTTTTRARIGSTSKILTALGVMKLTEQVPGFTVKKPLYTIYQPGVLTDPIWPLVLQARPGNLQLGTAIRVDHLLSHSTGFTGNASVAGAAALFGVPESQVTYEQAHVDYLLDHTIAYAPGTSSGYCNHNLGMCTLVIERTAGVSYASYIRNQICSPIGLANTWPTDTAPSGIDAMPHRYVDGVPVTWPDREETHPLGYAAGGWSSTARDLVRLMCATDRLPNQSDVLSPATLDLMESRPYPTGAPSRAHGWQYEAPKGKLWHNGSIGGGASFIAKFPPGYISANGTDLSNVNVAICVNIQNAGALDSLVDQVALAVGAASIPVWYDLFASIGL